MNLFLTVLRQDLILYIFLNLKVPIIIFKLNIFIIIQQMVLTCWLTHIVVLNFKFIFALLRSRIPYH